MSESQNVSDAPSYERTAEELQHFLDIPLKVGIQLGQRSMKVRDILRLQPNSIVDLPKSAGENVDILINGRIIAFGEVMELEGSTGIRVTDLKSLP
jgi:flagellar motor switch protein FliN/FliY